MYHQQIKKNPERISKIKPLINNLDWDNINFPLQEQDYKTLEMNNKSVDLNILCIQNDTEETLISLNLTKQEKNK